MGDLTGENSGIVIPRDNGAKLAIDEYNATNPATKIEIVDLDSQGQRGPGGAADHPGHLRRHRRSDRPGVLRRVKAVGPVLEQGKIPSVSPLGDEPGPGRERLDLLAPDRGPTTPTRVRASSTSWSAPRRPPRRT
jgi:branched-chain amino acid transport system substrate-binding protein